MSECLRTYGPQIIRVPQLQSEDWAWLVVPSYKLQNQHKCAQQHPGSKPGSKPKRCQPVPFLKHIILFKNCPTIVTIERLLHLLSDYCEAIARLLSGYCATITVAPCSTKISLKPIIIFCHLFYIHLKIRRVKTSFFIHRTGQEH